MSGLRSRRIRLDIDKLKGGYKPGYRLIFFVGIDVAMPDGIFFKKVERIN
jgi:hypothetical protein